jgi:hypothetical protein
VQADGFKWAAGPTSLQKGSQIAVLFGDPAKEGAYGYRVKVPAGYTVPAHMHPTDENITVMSGTFIIVIPEIRLEDADNRVLPTLREPEYKRCRWYARLRAGC